MAHYTALGIALCKLIALCPSLSFSFPLKLERGPRKGGVISRRIKKLIERGDAWILWNYHIMPILVICSLAPVYLRVIG